MTAILGYADGKTVWIGGDSRALDGWTPTTLVERKVFCISELIIGGSGVLRHLQAIRLRFQAPEQSEDEDDEHYICVRVMDELRDCLKEAGTALSDEQDGVSTALLLGYHGVLYYVSPALCADHPREQVGWLGSGGDLAMGAFCAFMKLGQNVEDAMRHALAISAAHNLTVSAPFYVEALGEIPQPARRTMLSGAFIP